jgi:FKBP-type peptidyl-prolyl cis-trans isomerase
MNRLLPAVLLMLIFAGCSDSRERFTDSGMRYLLHTDLKGKKPQKSDYVTVELVCHTDDTVLIDTRKLGTPFRLQLNTVPFAGSYEEGLFLLGLGDSASFFVSADSLFKSVFAGVSGVRQEDTKMKKGTFVQYDVKLLKIQTYADAETEMQLKFSRMEREEKRILSEFIARNKIITEPDSTGLYKVMTVQGRGIPVDTGKTVTVQYRSRLMDGSVVSATEKGKPMQFILGRGEVLKGWEIAFRGARVGDRFSLIMPSRLAYGEVGLKDPATAKFIIPPYASLIFDIAVEDVSDEATAAK